MFGGDFYFVILLIVVIIHFSIKSSIGYSDSIAILLEPNFYDDWLVSSLCLLGPLQIKVIQSVKSKSLPP